MGRYINELPNGEKLPANGKADKLLSTVEGTEELETVPEKWEEDIVCVVDNGSFEAAAYAYNESELQEFSRFDGRPKRWLKVPNAGAFAK
jgi:hypothetical protein